MKNRSAVSASCELTPDEEMALFNSNKCFCDPDDPNSRKWIAEGSGTRVELLQLFNRQLTLEHTHALKPGTLSCTIAQVDERLRSASPNALLNPAQPAQWAWPTQWHSALMAEDADAQLGITLRDASMTYSHQTSIGLQAAVDLFSACNLELCEAHGGLEIGPKASRDTGVG